MSATSLSKLISTRKEELARLLEWRGTNFPVVERQNDLRISFIELELEDLEKLNNQPQLNENQQIVLEWLKANVEQDNASPMCAVFLLGEWQTRIGSKEFRNIDIAYCSLDSKQQAQVLQAFSQWAQEQEEE